MTTSKFIKITSLLTLIVVLSGCSLHSRHHYGYRHSGVHIHGHVHGRPSRVVGALIAGAIIGSAINAMIYRERDYEDRDLPATPGENYYLLTEEGNCHWVEVDDNGYQTRTEVDYNNCVSH